MAFSTAGGGPSRPEMNVTPLIDILLVLIIVFMLIVATSKEYVVNTQLPEEAKGEEPHQNERTIVIQIIWSPQQQAPLLKINQESVYPGTTWSRHWRAFSSAVGKRSPTSKAT
jgi:biopolymer transport protein TolR